MGLAGARTILRSTGNGNVLSVRMIPGASASTDHYRKGGTGASTDQPTAAERNVFMPQLHVGCDGQARLALVVWIGGPDDLTAFGHQADPPHRCGVRDSRCDAQTGHVHGPAGRRRDVEFQQNVPARLAEIDLRESVFPVFGGPSGRAAPAPARRPHPDRPIARSCRRDQTTRGVQISRWWSTASRPAHG